MAWLVLRSMMKYCSWILWMKFHFIKEKHFHRSSLSPVAIETHFLEDSRWGANLINRKFAWKQHSPVIIIGIYGVEIKLLLFRVTVVVFSRCTCWWKNPRSLLKEARITQRLETCFHVMLALMKFYSDIHSLYLVLCSYTVSIQISCCLLTLFFKGMCMI